MVASFAAPHTPLVALQSTLVGRGYAVLAPQDVAALAGVPVDALTALVPSWDDLRHDRYLKDGGNYRKRRHSCFVAEAGALRQVPHRMHWQSEDYNALHGGMERWFVEAHQFRIDTHDGIGRPTPEGAHRDGVDFVAVLLVNRHAIKGGETRVFQADGPDGQRFTLAEPWSLLLLDDARMIHESTPIQPVDEYGYRDTLVLTFRANGFQGDDAG